MKTLEIFDFLIFNEIQMISRKLTFTNIWANAILYAIFQTFYISLIIISQVA